MNSTTFKAQQAPRYPVPEPDLTPAQLIARATAMRERLVKEAEASRMRGGFSEETHAAFTQAGFYRILVPRMFGGYEMGLDTFLKVVMEVARADPGTAWGMGLSAGHALQLASYFSEQAQAEAFGPDGHFVCPQRALPEGTAIPVDGGYRVSGEFHYASGVPHANWFMGAAMVAAAHLPESAPKQIGFLVPRKQFEVLNDWGRGSVLGLEATGSNTVVMKDVFVPAHMTDRFDWSTRELGDEGTPGYRLHRNPLYLGRIMTYFGCELSAPIVGAAFGALDEYRATLLARKTSFPPSMLRKESSFYLQWYGEALGLAESARALLLAAAAQYTERGLAWAETRAPFGVAEDTRMRQVALQAGRLAVAAIEKLFTTAGTTAARSDSRLLRYFCDASTYRTHVTSQWEIMSHSAALADIGEPHTM